MDGKKLAKSFREGVPSKDGALSMRLPKPASTKNNAPRGGSYDKTNQAPPPCPISEREIRSTDTKWPAAPKELRDENAAGKSMDFSYGIKNYPFRPRSPSERARADDGISRATAAAAAPKPSAEVVATFKQLGRQRRKEKEDAERRRREEEDRGPIASKEEPKKETGQPANTQLTPSMAPRGKWDIHSPKAAVMALKPLEDISLPPRPHMLQPMKGPFDELLPRKAMSYVGHTDEDEDWEHLSSDSSDSEDDTDTVGEWEML
ncbi:hypothetical protein F5X68DRAFT_245083 [Plectosphaerella plurivora]|uniref:Uncharacterized protein n=1 Tax=Plectosphaerella plurivora TaxID=936078 RepID=A0A9P9A8D8_9PEZI|nr:hypothetical protein F5X68DRAFT_245083 [Plectosphaerella plurivora]